MSKLSRIQAIFLAIFVTIIWSFSWVLIKIGLQDDIPPFTFAGLRYFGASIVLFAFVMPSQTRRESLMQLTRRDIGHLTILGLAYYTATQGLIFLALTALPAAMFSLILNFSPIVVMIGGVIFLRELPNRWQYLGLALFILGTILYFSPTPTVAFLGLAIGIAAMLANSVSSIIGRAVNRRGDLDAVTVTLVSMGIGSSLLLLFGLLFEGLPTISLQGWGIILWLAFVHTALTFPLWNLTLTVLSASESSIINNTMLVQIAVLAWVFLGEALSLAQMIALAIASAGILIFQIRKTRTEKRV